MVSTFKYKTEIEDQYPIANSSISSESFEMLEFLTRYASCAMGGLIDKEVFFADGTLFDSPYNSIRSVDVQIHYPLEKRKSSSQRDMSESIHPPVLHGYIISEPEIWGTKTHSFQDIIDLFYGPQNLHEISLNTEAENRLKKLDIRVFNSPTRDRLLKRLNKELTRLEKKDIILPNKELFVDRIREGVDYFTAPQFNDFQVDLELISDGTSLFTITHKDIIEIHYEIYSKHVNLLGEEEVLFTIYYEKDCLGTGWDTNTNALARINEFLEINMASS